MATAPSEVVAPANAQLPANMTDPVALQAMLYGNAPVILEGQVQPPQPPASAPTPPPPVEPAAPAAGVTPPAVQPPQVQDPADPRSPEGTPEPDGRILPRKIPTDNLDTEGQRALALQHTLNNGKRPGEPGFVSLASAIQTLQAADTPPPPPPAPAPQPTHLDTLTQELQGAETRLTELRARRAELAREGTLYGEEIDQVNTEIEDTIQGLATQRADLRIAEREYQQTEAQRQESARQTELRARQDAMATVLQEFPSANDEQSPLGQEVKALVTELKQPGNPDRPLLSARNASAVITEQAATRLAKKMAAQQGISFGQALDSLRAPAGAPATTPEPGMPPRVLPGVGGTGAHVPVPQKSARELLAEAGTDPVKLAALQASMSGGSGGMPWFIR